MRKTIILTAMVFLGTFVKAQVLTPKEEKIDSMIIALIDKKAFVPEYDLLTDTEWSSSDLMGTRTISFSKDRFKQVNDGSRGKYDKINGSWSIYDQFVVLDVKKQKTSLYVIKYQNEIMLIDAESIDITRKLLMQMIINDQWMGKMTEEEIFGFLIGYKKVG